MNRSLRKLAAALLPPLFLGLIFTFWVYRSPYHLFPNPKISTYAYADDQREGRSEVTFTEREQDEIRYGYILRKGFPFPYAGFTIHPDSGFFPPLSGYDYLEIEIYTREAKELYLYLLSYEPEVDVPEDDLSRRQLKRTIKTKNAPQPTRVALDEFVTAEWWYQRFDKPEDEFGPPDFDRITKLNISSISQAPKDLEEVVVLKSVRFGKDYRAFAVGTGVGLLVYYAFLFYLLPLFHSRKEPKTIVVPKQEILIVPEEANETEKCAQWMSENYMNAAVSLEGMAKELGLGTRKISELINRSFQLTFKQYLNTLRTNEAKRLLKETDWPINEVAYKVGFNNSSHFNRTFKQYTEFTPLEYRNGATLEQGKKKSE